MTQDHCGETKTTTITTTTRITHMGREETTTRIEAKIATRTGRTGITTITMIEVAIRRIMEIVEATTTIAITVRIDTTTETMMRVKTRTEKGRIWITRYSTSKASRMTTLTTDVIILIVFHCNTLNNNLYFVLWSFNI